MADTLNLSVITKIQKLLALANDNGATEAEATNAAEKAQFLMAEYNIEMATVAAHNGAVSDRSTDRTVYKWRRELMRQIGTLNFCIVETEFKYEGRRTSFEGFTIYGRQANVASAQVMFNYLTQIIERLARDWATGEGHNIFAKPAILFREGCAERVISRLDTRYCQILAEQRAKAKAEAARAANASYSGSTMPAVILADYAQDEADANKDLRYGYAPGTTAANRRKANAQSAAIAAYRREHNCSWSVAYDVVVRKYSHEKAVEMDRPTAKIDDSPKAQARRERADQAWRDRMNRENQREYGRKSSEGYVAGRRAGDTVKL